MSAPIGYVVVHPDGYVVGASPRLLPVDRARADARTLAATHGGPYLVAAVTPLAETGPPVLPGQLPLPL